MPFSQSPFNYQLLNAYGGLQIAPTITNPSVSKTFLNTNPTITNTSGSINNNTQYGAALNLNIGAVNTSQWNTVLGFASVTQTLPGTTGGILSAYGASIVFSNQATGTNVVNNAYGVVGHVSSALTTNILYAIGGCFYAANGGSNTTDLLLGSLSLTSGQWAIYSNSAYPSVFKGQLITPYSFQTETTGFNITLSSTNELNIIDAAGTLATGTIVMPASPIDGEICGISFDAAITTLTVSPNAGQTIKNAPTTAVAGQGFCWIYRAANTTWYRTY